MGLFGGTQEVTLGLSKGDYVLEKVTLPLKKNKIDVYLKKGTLAFINGVEHKEMPGKAIHLDAEIMGGKKKDVIEFYLYPDKVADTIEVKFHAGSHSLRISTDRNRIASFAIVGTAQIRLSDYQLLIEHYDRTITKADILADVNGQYRRLLGDEIDAAAKKYINPESTTEIELATCLNKIVDDVFAGSRKTGHILRKMGLSIAPNSISLTINPLGDADAAMADIIERINSKAIAAYDNEEKEKQYQREQEELAAARKHELDMEKARHTTVTESKTDSKQDTTITRNDNGVKVEEQTHKFCIQCGNKVPLAALFCSKCGAKQE